MAINLRLIRARRREMLRSLGAEIRRLREDAGLTQAVVAREAGISGAYLSTIEAGLREPSLEVLLRLSVVLGADLSIRYFPTTGPAIRDRLQVAMGEGLLPALAKRWCVATEVTVYRPVRGVIDLVLEDRPGIDTVASELQSELRRVEQQVRWQHQKADALAALPDQQGRRVTRLLVARNTQVMREVARTAEATLHAAYPARTADAEAALRGEAPWPGSAVVWMRLDAGQATLLDVPPRGVKLGR